MGLLARDLAQHDIEARDQRAHLERMKLVGVPVTAAPPASGFDGEARVEAILGEVLRRRRDFVDALVTYTGDEIADLVADASTRGLLVSSISENTLLLIQTLYEGHDPTTVEAPPGAVQYARRLAQNDVSIASLMRAYRFGQARFTAMCLEVAGELPRLEVPVLSTIVTKVALFIDRICDIVAREYEQERERWVRSRSGVRQHWINEVLIGEVTDVSQIEGVLGYPLQGTHLAVELWSVDSGTRADSLKAFDRVTAYITRALGPHTPHLLVTTGEHEGRAWFATRAAHRVSTDDLTRWLREQGLGVRLAIGDPHGGLEGFRRSTRQASRAKELASSHPTRTAVAFAEVAAVAMLRDDKVELGNFVRRVLGGLAEPGERNEGLRETLRVFLEHGGDHARAAQLLHVHRNTVRYRIEQALQSIDPESPRVDNSRDTMLALSILDWRRELCGHA